MDELATKQLGPEMFRRLDEKDDSVFYTVPRKLVHIDQGAIDAAAECIGRIFPDHGSYLDLMSSWRSHLPEGFANNKVVGLGLNAEEMADNPDLDTYVIHDLNKSPRLPFPDAHFDGIFMTVSIQYVTQPLQLFAEVRRILRDNSPFLVLFSNRMFPTKAVRIWQVLSDGDRAELVQAYFKQTGGYGEPVAEDCNPQRSSSDPMYAVFARKTIV